MRTIKAKEESWEDYFCSREQERRIPVIEQLLQNAAFCPDSARIIRDYSYRSSEVAGAGFFMIGDAVGFVDPIFALGVALAMYGGCVASGAIERSLNKPASAAKNRAIFSEQVLGRLELARALALPRYPSTGEVTAWAQNVAQMEHKGSQELMNAVSAT